jgi:hypothetical protein
MAKKVNGYMINRAGWIEFDQAPDENGPWVPCTMVISDKAHERVFTESEVRAIVRKAICSQSDPGAFVVRLARATDNESVAGWKRRALQYVLNALDPA